MQAAEQRLRKTVRRAASATVRWRPADCSRATGWLVRRNSASHADAETTTAAGVEAGMAHGSRGDYPAPFRVSLGRVATDSSDDYYALLGIDAAVDGAELRRAWRRLALRWHPDRAGVGATATFQKISAAYAVLSDPVARAAYDRRRGSAVRSPGVQSVAATRRSAPGVLLRRVSGPLNALLARGVARRVAGDVIELFLDGPEVSGGGMISISMRVLVHCSACAVDAVESCARCGTTRTVDELFSAWLAVPPGVADGTFLIPSALLSGMVRPVSFRVRAPRAT